MKNEKIKNEGMTLPELILAILMLVAFTGITVMVTQFTAKFFQPMNENAKEENISTNKEEELISSVFKVMESRLYSVIATPAMVAVWLTGIYLVYVQGNQFWLNLKIFFVFLMTLYHFFLFFSLKKFEDDLNNFSERFFRIINEVPTLLVIIIVGLVVFKPS